MKSVVYYRKAPNGVKTRKPLKFQKLQVKAFTDNHGYDITEEFTETESKKNKDFRPTLKKAIQSAKDQNKVLIISYSGNLEYSPHFLGILKESDVTFTFADKPELNNFTVDQAYNDAVEHWESHGSQVSESLKRRWAKGEITPAGATAIQNPKWQKKASKAGAKATVQKHLDHYAEIVPLIAGMREKKEPVSYPKIAERLNELGYVTARGGKFHAGRVHDVWKRYGANQH